MNLQSRVVNILTKPRQEWQVISMEATDVATLYKEYVAPLTAIPAICGFLGMTIIGVSLPLVGTVRTPMGNGLTSLILHYILSLAGVYLAAFVINGLAPKFQSSSSIVRALEMVAYASTASWVAGVLLVFPALSPLAVLAGLYGIYIYYLGLPVLMKTPPDRVIPYMVVSAVIIIVITAVVGVISAGLTGIARV